MVILSLCRSQYSEVLESLEDTARCAGLLLACAEGFGLQPRLFLRFKQQKILILCCVGPFLASLVSSSNLGHF